MSARRKRKQVKLYEPSGEHLFISPEIIRKEEPERRVPVGPKKKRAWVPRKPFSQLRDEAFRVLKVSSAKNVIIQDHYLYFVLSLTSNFSSPSIVKFLERSRVVPIEFGSDKVAKVRVLKGDFQGFLSNLETFQRYVEEIRESSLSEKVDEKLLETIEKNPEGNIQVDIAISQLPGTELIDQTRGQIERYLHSRNLTIDPIYRSDTFLLLSAELPGSIVKEMAQNLDSISKVYLSHPFQFQSRPQPKTRKKGELFELQSISLRASGVLPVLCIIDSGINSAHSYLQPYIVDTYDVTTNSSTPCSDVVGHGSAVAGMAIYEGDVNSSPKSRVVAVKLTNAGRFSTLTLRSIEFVVKKFKQLTRVFNLSFSSLGPNPSTSKAIDDLAFRENILFVVSAGNIDSPTIVADLNSGETYPKYLLKHHIYCPGDCFNVLTVGSYASKSSNIIPEDSPSPFTRSRRPGMSVLKPELLEVGGNMN